MKKLICALLVAAMANAQFPVPGGSGAAAGSGSPTPIYMIAGGVAFTLSSGGTTRYVVPIGSSMSAQSVEANAQILAPATGTLISFTTAFFVGSGQTVTATVRVNESSTDLEASSSVAGGNIVSDTGSVAITENDLISIQYVNAGSMNSSFISKIVLILQPS